MTIRVLFFAQAKELAAMDSITLEMPPGSPIRQLRQELEKRFPALAGFLPRCQWAVNDTLAQDDMLLFEDATVAILPPVSGG